MRRQRLDERSPEANYLANVEGKHISRGKATTYELDLSAWGPITHSNKLRVGPETYNAIERGDVVYLSLKQGRWGIKWYFMRQWQRR